MKRHVLALVLFLSFHGLFAQMRPADPAVVKNDSIIISDIINPKVAEAEQGGGIPNWDALKSAIKEKYNDTYADRTVSKARIYYYYGKDWPLFSKEIVHYTVSYEDKEDLRLMNKNARMILKYSKDPEDWKAAVVWVQHAVDKEPGNAAYKETRDGLTAKINGN